MVKYYQNDVTESVTMLCWSQLQFLPYLYPYRLTKYKFCWSSILVNNSNWFTSWAGTITLIMKQFKNLFEEYTSHVPRAWSLTWQ